MTTTPPSSSSKATPQSSSKLLSDAWAELVSVRDQARIQVHLFSLDAKQSWNELEAKLQALPSDGPADTVLVRLRELTRLARAFIDEHRQPAAGTAAALMTQNVRTCSREDTLDQAARVMWEADCGAVPVLDSQGKLVGILTDRDVCMAAYTRGQPLWACSVATVMSTPCYHCAPNDSIERVTEIMRKHGIRRVPVTDSDGSVLGLVALADLGRFAYANSNAPGVLPEFASTVAAVSAPRVAKAAE